MEKTLMKNWAKKIIRKTGFKNPQLIYTADHRSPENLRNLIFKGIFQQKPAVLKIYDEPKRIREAASLVYFNKTNKSRKLIGPKLYRAKELSPTRGWYIMEKLPADGYFLSGPDAPKPLSPSRRKEFLDVYIEYRKYFPRKPFRPLLLAEKLPAEEFHITRIHRWFEMANEKEIELEPKGQRPILDPKIFLPLYLKAQALIRKAFNNRKMFWSHGHFKPHEIFFSPQKNIYYLTDFAHTYFYPEGYELGFMIWADWLLGADWKRDYNKWKKGIEEWKKDVLPVMRKLKMKNPALLLKASLTERTLGAILADVTASQKPIAEKRGRVKVLIKFLEELVN